MSCGIRYIEYSSTIVHSDLTGSCQKLIVGPTGVLCIKFNIFYKGFGIGDAVFYAFKNFFTSGLKFVLDMIIRCPYSGMDSGTFCLDRKSTRLNSSHVAISYAVFCLKKTITLRN